MNDEFSDITLTPQSLEVQATEVLRDLILAGYFLPGFRLIETQLAKKLNLSRATIRTALHQLVHEGLVIQVLHKGWTVRTFTLQDTWELFTLRTALESLAARLACEAMTPKGEKTLRNTLKRLKNAVLNGDLKAIADVDFQLHKAIIQLSGHQQLQAQYKLVEQQIRLYIISCESLFPDLNEITLQHEQLVEAICSGDSQLAEQTAKEHSTDGKMFAQFTENQ